MKKFAFTLQSVHNVREFRKEKEMNTLSELQATVDAARERVAEIERRRLEAMHDYAARLNSRENVSPLEMELNSNHFASLNRMQREAEAELAERLRECMRQSAVVAAAARDAKITDRLRQMQQEKHRLEAARAEQNSIDELVSANFARSLTRPR